MGSCVGCFTDFGSHRISLAMKELQEIYRFIQDIEPLKDTLRTGRTQQGRQESVAEHSWRLAMMAIIIGPKYFPNVDLEKVMRMCLVHDLGEIINGDIPAPAQKNLSNKSEAERQDFLQVIASLPKSQTETLIQAWDEYEAAATQEAKLVKALDKLETIIQHNQGNDEPEFDHAFDLTYGQQYMDLDPVVKALRKLVDHDTKEKVRS